MLIQTGTVVPSQCSTVWIDPGNKICKDSQYVAISFPKTYASPPVVVASVVGVGPDSPCMNNSARGFSTGVGTTTSVGTIIWGWASPMFGFCGGGDNYAGSLLVQWTAYGLSE